MFPFYIFFETIFPSRFTLLHALPSNDAVLSGEKQVCSINETRSRGRSVCETIMVAEMERSCVGNHIEQSFEIILYILYQAHIDDLWQYVRRTNSSAYLLLLILVRG